MNNQANQKLSPNHPLNTEQNELVNKIITFASDHLQRNDYPAIFTIYGEADTGKSVVLSALFDRIQKLSHEKGTCFSNTHNYFLVNHPELLKVYKQIAGPLKELLKKNYMRPTSFINQMDKKDSSADVVVIDEAHLLLSQPDHYNNFYHNNQLTEIIKRAKIIVLVFDEYQVLRMKSFWTTERLQKITHQYAHKDYHLHHQFRMTAPDSLLNWFNDFTHGYLKPLNKNMWQNYDFRVFTDAEEMRQAIVHRNKEVGSIYTCQGFDLNYAGIIIGPPISQIPHTNQLKVNLDKITDIEMFKKRTDITNPQEKIKYEEKMVMNSLNVLFKRGIKGTYLYAHDPLLRQNLKHLFIEANNK